MQYHEPYPHLQVDLLPCLTQVVPAQHSVVPPTTHVLVDLMQVAVGLLVVGLIEGATVVEAFDGAIVGGVVGTGGCVGERVGDSVGVEVGKMVGDSVGARVGMLDVGFDVVGGCKRESGMNVCVREWIHR
jgi:hypothetical protein